MFAGADLHIIEESWEVCALHLHIYAFLCLKVEGAWPPTIAMHLLIKVNLHFSFLLLNLISHLILASGGDVGRLTYFSIMSTSGKVLRHLLGAQ